MTEPLVGSAPPFPLWVQGLIAGIGVLLLFWPRPRRSKDESRREAVLAGGAAPPIAGEQPGPRRPGARRLRRGKRR